MGMGMQQDSEEAAPCALGGNGPGMMKPAGSFRLSISKTYDATARPAM
jgi:hypothetical protein